MGILNEQDKIKFEKALKDRFGKKEGYLSNSFRKNYEKEVYLTGELDDIIKKLIAFLNSKKIYQVLVFPDGDWYFSDSKINNEPFKLNLKDIPIFLNKYTDPGLNNYYVSAKDLRFKWIFTICNEGDYHFSSSKEFANPIKKYFSNIPKATT